MHWTRASASPPASTRSLPTTAARKSPACWPAPRSPPRRGRRRTGCCARQRRNFPPSFRGDAKHRTRNLEIPRCAIAHLRSGPPDHPGMTSLVTNRFVQIVPLRILCFDQVRLPTPPPLLEFFLTGNRGSGIVVYFEPN